MIWTIIVLDDFVQDCYIILQYNIFVNRINECTIYLHQMYVVTSISFSCLIVLVRTWSDGAQTFLFGYCNVISWYYCCYFGMSFVTCIFCKRHFLMWYSIYTCYVCGHWGKTYGVLAERCIVKLAPNIISVSLFWFCWFAFKISQNPAYCFQYGRSMMLD